MQIVIFIQRKGLLMMQDEMNQLEWNNPINWRGPKLIRFYFSKKDTRTWVLKKIPIMGWTLNLAHPLGILWLIVFIGIFLGIILLTIFT
jgi:uncharacterized membrane protein